MSEDSIKPKDLNEISTRLSELNVIRISFVDEPAVPDAEFKIVKNFIDMEGTGLNSEQITKSLDNVSKQLDIIISQRNDDAILIKSVIADTDENKQLIAKNSQVIDNLAGQIASAITAIELVSDNNKESDDDDDDNKTYELDSDKVITDVVEDSEQGPSDGEIEKFAASFKEYYDLGLLEMDEYKANLQLLISE